MDNGHPPGAVGADIEGVGAGMQSLIGMLRVLFFVLRILIILTFLCLVFSGMFFVREHEEAMLFRFGKLQQKDSKEILTSGEWYWAWPYPIDRVKRVAEAQRSVMVTTTQFWPEIQALDIAGEARPGPDSAAVLRPGQDGYLLTGDANIMHLIWTITYRVDDAKKYYLHFYDSSDAAPSTQDGNAAKRGAEAIIRSVLENAVLVTVAGCPVDTVFYKRDLLRQRVNERVTDMIAELDMGIDVQQVSLSELQPPVATRRAFQEVVDADQIRRTEIDTAEAYKKRVELEALGEAANITAEAEAYRTRIVESVKAEKNYFATVLEEYRKNPKTMLVALYTDAIRDVLDQVETKYIVRPTPDGRQELRLQLGPEPEKSRNVPASQE